MARIVSLDFVAIFKVFGLDAAASAAADAGTILDSGQAPSPHAQGWNKPQGETPRSDLCNLPWKGHPRISKIDWIWTVAPFGP